MDNAAGYETGLYETAETMCAVCGANPIDISENETSFLCGECRDKYLRLTIPPWVIGFLLLVCAAAAALSLQLPTVMDTYKTYLQAERDRKDKKFSPAVNGYVTVLDQYGDSVPIIIKALDSAMGAQYFDGAAYILNTYLVGKSLNDEQYDHATAVSNFLEREFDTHDACEEILYEYGEDTDILKATLLELLDESNYNKAYIYFLVSHLSPEIEDQLHYMRLATEQDKWCTYPLAYYGNMLRSTGDLQTAMNIYSEALGYNAYDAYALRGIGIVEMLRGDLSQGLKTIQTAYEMNPYEMYMPEALIIALAENDRRDEALALMEVTLAEDHEFDQDMYDYLDGRINLMEYYTQ